MGCALLSKAPPKHGSHASFHHHYDLSVITCKCLGCSSSTAAARNLHKSFTSCDNPHTSVEAFSVWASTMIDHLVGRPSPSWKRLQVSSNIERRESSPDQVSVVKVFLVLFFWTWRIIWGDARGPRLLWIRKFNRRIGMLYSRTRCRTSWASTSA